MEGTGFLKARPGGLRKFLNVKGAAPVLIGGDEVFSSAHELGFFRGGFRRRNRLRFGDQFRTKRSRKSILRRFRNLLLALDVDRHLFLGDGCNLRERHGAGGEGHRAWCRRGGRGFR